MHRTAYLHKVVTLLLPLCLLLSGCAVPRWVYDTSSLNKLGHPEAELAPTQHSHSDDDDLAAYVEATSKPSKTYFDLLAQPRIKAMCAKEHPEYCQWPMVPHCHGTYCHAHPGGEYEHTHFGDREFADSERGPRDVEPRVERVKLGK